MDKPSEPTSFRRPIRKDVLPFSLPLIAEEDIDEVVDTLRSNWITTGRKAERFERRFAEYVNAPAALAVSSCTGALHASLLAFGIGPGDIVITTPMTFCATVNVIEHCGARPLLVDVEPETLTIDPNQIEGAVTRLRKSETSSRIRAVIPVHIYGQPCEMDSIRELSRRHDLAVVEDAAHALPSKYNGRFVGEIPQDGPPTAVCFSFYATKNLTTGEGGMLTASPDVIREARIWSSAGISRSAHERNTWQYEVDRPGYKYNMSDIQASIGLRQLDRLDALSVRRSTIVERYTRAFEDVEELQIPVARAGTEPSWHIFALRLNLDRLRIDRDQFIRELKKRKIETSVHFIPVHVQPYYRRRYDYKPESFPIAFREYQRLISLPLNPRLTDDDVEDVIAAVIDVARDYRA